MTTETPQSSPLGHRLLLVIGFAVYVGMQVFLTVSPLWNWNLTPEVDDSLTYVLKSRQMEECFTQNCPALQDLRQQFGDAVEVDDGFQWEWISIPHIYKVPFYCYAYSFGQLLVLALYQRYKEQGASFIPGYLRILAYGGSASPEHILSEAGIDMTSADFWQGGFDVIRGMVEQLAGL